MVNYNDAKIYKIEPLNKTDENDTYYGSTCLKMLCQRMRKHRYDYKDWKNGKCCNIRSFVLFEKYGVENCQIILLENYPCETRDELRAREAEYIKNKPCVNKANPYRTEEDCIKWDKEYREANKEKIREMDKIYREEHKDELKEKNKIYREKNKEKLSEKSKIYRENNTEKIKETQKTYTITHKEERKKYKQQYYQNNADKIKEQDKIFRTENKEAIAERRKQRIECECGTSCIKDAIARHKRSKSHQELMNQKNNIV